MRTRYVSFTLFDYIWWLTAHVRGSDPCVNRTCSEHGALQAPSWWPRDSAVAAAPRCKHVSLRSEAREIHGTMQVDIRGMHAHVRASICCILA